LKESLGFGGCVSLFGGGIGILAVLGFLTFLWFGHGSETEGRNATKTWRSIVLSDWMTRTITLTALVLRVIVSAQATICTSMIAALILEKRSAPKSNVAHLSVIRGINGGPRQLMGLVLSSKSAAMALNLEFWLIMFLGIVTLALQFSSTILVSDLNDFVIVGNFNRTQVMDVLSWSGNKTSIFYDPSWLARPLVLSIFGEVQSQADITPDSNGFSNSGLIQRGFVPLEGSQNRTSVRHYQGNAMVMSSKTACMRPVIDAQYRVPDWGPTPGPVDNLSFGHIVGFLDYGASLRNAYADVGTSNNSQGLEGVYFDCNIPATVYVNESQSSFCIIGAVGGNFWALDSSLKWNYTDDPWSTNSSIYLAYTTNMDVQDWFNAPINESVLPGTPYDEWETYNPLADRFVNISLCFSAFDIERQFVDMNTSGILQEPIVDWSSVLLPNDEDYSFNITDIQNYVSIGSSLSLQDRGLLNMTILGEPQDGPSSSLANRLVPYDSTNGEVNSTISLALLTGVVAGLLVYNVVSNQAAANSTFFSCFVCIGSGQTLHIDSAVLFNNLITSTQRPVQAMQSFLTTMAATIFDDYQSSLGISQDAQLATTTTARAPGPCSQHGCAGFATVVTLVVAHLICVAAITALYLLQVRYSRIGNIWHVVSQLVSDELKETLVQGSDKSDVTINKSLKREGNDYFVRVKRSLYDGRIEVMKYGSDGYVSGDSDAEADVHRFRGWGRKMALKKR
jgi:hypothetical protein